MAGSAGEQVTDSVFAPAYRATSVGILILVTLIAFEAMAVTTALPTAARQLHGIGAIGWAFTCFLTANIVGLVVSGQLCDRRGAALPAAAGVALFACGLAISGSATSMAQLVSGRAVQGFGGGLLLTAVYVLVGEVFDDAMRPRFFSVMSSAWVLPVLIGPVLSGSLAEQISWRWVFIGLLPLVLVGAVLLRPALRVLPTKSGAGLPAPMQIVRALAAALGVAGLEEAGQHQSPLTAVGGGVGLVALVWGLRALLPAGTVRVRRGVSAPIAMRGLIAGSMFGVEALIPLMLTLQHGYGALAAGAPLMISGLLWSASSSWQGRRRHDGDPDRVRMIRAGFVLVALAAASTAIVAQPAAPGWLIWCTWALSGIGAGLTIPSTSVLMLRYTNDVDRGGDSAALQLSDAVTTAVTTGLGGVLVAAAARGALGYTMAFTVLDGCMVVIALLGAAVAGQARPPRPG